MANKEPLPFDVIGNLYSRIDAYEDKLRTMEADKHQHCEDKVQPFSQLDSRQLRDNIQETHDLNLKLYDKLSIYSKQNCKDHHMVESYEALEKRNIALQLEIEKLKQENLILNQEKSNRMIEDQLREQARLREIELQRQKEKEKQLSAFAYITVDTHNVRGNKQKNADHLNKYKMKELELQNEIQQLEKDLSLSNKHKALFELQNVNFEKEVTFLRQGLSEKIKEIEVLRQKLIDYNIPDSADFNLEDTDYKHHYAFLKKLEHRLRNEINQKDTALVELNIVCENEKQSNSKLMDQLIAAQKQVKSLTNHLKSANRLDKQQCYKRIDELEKDNQLMANQLFQRDEELQRIYSHHIYRHISYDIAHIDDISMAKERDLYKAIEVLNQEKIQLQIELKHKLEEMEIVQERLNDHINQKVGNRFERDTQQIKMEADFLRLKDDMKGYVNKVFELESQNQILIKENHLLLSKINSDNLQKTEQQHLRDQYNNNVYKDISEKALITLNTQPNFSSFNEI